MLGFGVHLRMLKNVAEPNLKIEFIIGAWIHDLSRAKNSLRELKKLNFSVFKFFL